MGSCGKERRGARGPFPRISFCQHPQPSPYTYSSLDLRGLPISLTGTFPSLSLSPMGLFLRVITLYIGDSLTHVPTRLLAL